ncbi:hypothetical protein H4582DRAFT_1894843 [Lactarius indigo]|nr:hypothetical protein H4582DRAFT_1894843 [Lactarius indigo]
MSFPYWLLSFFLPFSQSLETCLKTKRSLQYSKAYSECCPIAIVCAYYHSASVIQRQFNAHRMTYLMGPAWGLMDPKHLEASLQVL